MEKKTSNVDVKDLKAKTEKLDPVYGQKEKADEEAPGQLETRIISLDISLGKLESEIDRLTHELRFIREDLKTEYAEKELDEYAEIRPTPAPVIAKLNASIRYVEDLTDQIALLRNQCVVR